MIVKEIKSNNVILLKMNGGNTSTEVLTELAEYSINKGLANEGYVEALLERESIFPTGIQGYLGVALPHSDQCYTKKSTVVIALLDTPSKFREMGGSGIVNTEIVFLLLLNHLEDQVKALESVVNLIQDEERMKALYTDKAIEICDEVFKQFA